MARVDIKCTEKFKNELKKFAELKEVSITQYIKNAVIKQMRSDERKMLKED